MLIGSSRSADGSLSAQGDTLIGRNNTDGSASPVTRRGHFIDTTVLSLSHLFDATYTAYVPLILRRIRKAKVAAHKDAFGFGDDVAAISTVPVIVDAEDGTDTHRHQRNLPLP